MNNEFISYLNGVWGVFSRMRRQSSTRVSVSEKLMCVSVSK